MQIQYRQVLNAWRRHWNRHIQSRSGAPCITGCSTPGGVIGIGTRKPIRIPGTTSGGAQRLAASLESARSPPPSCIDLQHRCSTPGGVIGIGTIRSGPSSGRLLAVLNAWRRHWNRHRITQGLLLAAGLCSTPGGVIGIGTTPARRSEPPLLGAQRLAASLESALGPAGSRPGRKGAQRLAASLESARWG